jgi:sulfoxide reductase heme-binding subunit YedZ
MQDLQNTIFQFVVKHKKTIITIFHIYYFIYSLLLIFVVYSIAAQLPTANFFFQNATLFGKLALLFFCITITSGILRRFGIAMKLSSSILLIRRYLGITTYLFALTHYLILRGIPYVTGMLTFTLSVPLFELMGVSAFTCLSFLFLTSNDFSVRKLGKWWSKLHKLVYIIVWLIFFHVAFQKIDLYSMIIGIYAVLEVTSHLYNFLKKRKQKQAVA